VAQGGERLTQAEDIGLAAAVGMQELVDHQHADGLLCSGLAPGPPFHQRV
jgi:hypothetical protein